jgi:hypothetical protein
LSRGELLGEPLGRYMLTMGRQRETRERRGFSRPRTIRAVATAVDVAQAFDAFGSNVS